MDNSLVWVRYPNFCCCPYCKCFFATYSDFKRHLDRFGYGLMHGFRFRLVHSFDKKVSFVSKMYGFDDDSEISVGYW